MGMWFTIYKTCIEKLLKTTSRQCTIKLQIVGFMRNYLFL